MSKISAVALGQIKTNNAQAKELKARKAYKHAQWIKRQDDYHKIIERDCYGVKSRAL